MGCIVDKIAYPSKYLPRQNVAKNDKRYIWIPVTSKISICAMVCHPSQSNVLESLPREMVCSIMTIRKMLFGTEELTPHTTNANRLIIYSHGNAETMVQNLTYGFMLADLACMPVLLYDYEGYGPSEGKSGEKTARRDVEAVYRHVRKAYPNHKVILMGRSIGSVTTVHLANVYANKGTYQEDRKSGVLAGIILQSGVASALQTLRERKLNIACDCLRNYDKVSNWSFPCLIIHGTCDDIVPVHNAIIMARNIIKRNHPSYLKSFESFVKKTRPLYMMDDHCMIRADNFSLLLIAGGDHNGYDMDTYELTYNVILQFLIGDGTIENSIAQVQEMLLQV